MEEIYIKYTYNLGLLRLPANLKVEKQAKLLKTPILLKEAIEKFESGDLDQGESMIRRKGDELLLFSIQNEDLDVADEAEKLYQLSKQYRDTYGDINHRLSM
ncbi:hypothetical protein D3C76_1314090 [compost metagenome]